MREISFVVERVEDYKVVICALRQVPSMTTVRVHLAPGAPDPPPMFHLLIPHNVVTSRGS